jgi:hypothetical protein
MKECCRAASIALVLLISGGCQQQRGGTPTDSLNRVLPIGIYMVATGCDVDYPTVNLRRLLKHRVSWQSADGQQYVVIFQPNPPGSNPKPGTPFVDSNNQPVFKFAVPANGDVKSGVPVVDGYFEYSINDSSGKECKDAKDPGVSVKP